MSRARRRLSASPVSRQGPTGAAIGADGLARIEAALGRVIDDPTPFTDFDFDFANATADRLERYGAATFFTERQWAVVARIEARIEELGG